MKMRASLRSARVNTLATIAAAALGLLGAIAMPGHATAADSGQLQQITGARADVADILAAAGSGDASAQLTLGYAYALGDGVIQDYVEAHKWFNLAAAAGEQGADQARDAIARKMTPAQVAKAQRLASNWQPSLEATPSAPPPAAMEPRDIARIQQLLRRRGYDAGPADGVPGNRTQQAITRYQRDQGLATEGLPSPELLAHLEQGAGGGVESLPPVTSSGTAGSSTSDAALATLVDDIRNLADSAERRRAAKPWVIDELRQLVDPYTARREVVILEDAFRDGDFTRNPPWEVVSGSFRVDPQYGLLSFVSTRFSAGDIDSTESLPGAILGAILDQANPAASSPARIRVRADIPNRFEIGMQVYSFLDTGQIEFSTLSAPNGQGYRLVLRPGAAVPAELHKVTSRGHIVVATYQRPITWAEGKAHDIRWHRDGNGTMAVLVDDSELFELRDDSVGGGFGVFSITNRGGDFAVRRVTISGEGG